MGKVMEHIELKLKLIRDLKSKVMIVPRGTHLEGAGAGAGAGAGVKPRIMNVPRGTSKGMGVGVESIPTNVPRGTSLEVIPVTDHINTVSIMGGTENHVIVKDGTFVIAHCKIVNGVASVVSDGWERRSYDLLRMLREVGY